MSYTTQTWANGDTITAEKLNHMESGIKDSWEFDAIISALFPIGSADPVEFTIEKGSYSALESIVLEKKNPAIMLKLANEEYYAGGFTSTVSLLTYYSDATDPKSMTFCFMCPSNDGEDIVMLPFYISWDDTDTLVVAD